MYYTNNEKHIMYNSNYCLNLVQDIIYSHNLKQFKFESCYAKIYYFVLYHLRNKEKIKLWLEELFNLYVNNNKILENIYPSSDILLYMLKYLPDNYYTFRCEQINLKIINRRKIIVMYLNKKNLSSDIINKISLL